MINMFRPHTKIKPLLLIAAFLLSSSLLQAQTPGAMPMPEVTIYHLESCVRNAHLFNHYHLPVSNQHNACDS